MIIDAPCAGAALRDVPPPGVRHAHLRHGHCGDQGQNLTRGHRLQSRGHGQIPAPGLPTGNEVQCPSLVNGYEVSQ